MTANQHQPGPLRRWERLVGERLAGGPPGAGLAPAAPAAEARREALQRYRRRLSAAQRRRRRGRGRTSGLLPATPPGPNWIPLGPFAVLHGQAASRPVVSGRVHDIAVSGDGQRVYVAAANGGVWRSTDAGRSWEPMSDQLDLDPALRQVDTLATGALALVEGADAAHDRLYVGTGEGHAGFGTGTSPDFFGVGMLLSTDGGATWVGGGGGQPEGSSPNLAGQSVFQIAVDPGDPEHAVAATTNGLYRRRQAAAPPWQREALPGLPAGARITSVVAGRQGGTLRFFACAQGGPVLSWSAAGGWAALPALPNAATAGRITLACSTSNPPVLYALAANAGGSFDALLRIDLGAGAPAWQTVRDAPSELFGTQGGYDQAAAVDPGDPNRVYVGGSTVSVGGEWSAALYRCEIHADAGGARSSTKLIGGSVHPDVHALTFRPGSSDELWVGCDGGLYVSHRPRGSGDRLFEACNTGLATLTLMGLGHHPSEESYGFCGAQDNGGVRYLGGEVWDHQLPGDGGDTVVDWNNPTRLLNVYVSADVRRADVDGSRYDYSDVGPSLGGEAIFFYPPLVGTPPSASPADAAVVAIGAERPWVSEQFGGGWTALPARPPAAAGVRVRSLAFASPTRLWAGWEDGHVAWYDKTGAGWTRNDMARAGEARPVTSIVVDPADATGGSVYVTLGGVQGLGGRVWRGTTGPAWTDQSGTGGGAPLLDVQHNALVVDPSNHQHLYVAADIGVWRSTNGGVTWQPFSSNLPDAAVLDLDLLPGSRLLRATTHGRGVWELPLGVPQPGVELVLRANVLDQRRRPARAGAALPGDHRRTSGLDESPDIAVDAPDRDGNYAVNPARPPDLVELAERVTGDRILASVPEAPAVTRVYVTVRNRGVTRSDGVRVALLLGPVGDAGPAALPAGFAGVPREGTPVDAGGWKTLGVRTVDGLQAGRPALVAFELRSDALPVAADAGGKSFALLALVHHPDDQFPAGATTDVTALVRGERRAAMRKVVAEPARGAAAGGAAAQGPPGGTALLVPVSAALLAHQRLGDVVDLLERKVKARRVSPGWAGFTARVNVHPVERRVLTLAQSALGAMRAGPVAPVPAHLPGAGIGSYALLGALGFELPGYSSVLAPGGDWVADALRRGTPDPNRSLVKVPSTELPLAVGRIGVAAAPAAQQGTVRGFTTGMLAAAAAGILVGPQLADLLAADTNRDWSRHLQSTGAAAAERHLRRRFLGGYERPSTIAAWLPAAGDVPAQLWESYLRALTEVYGLPGQRVRGFAAFEEDFDEGDWLTTTRLRNAYALLLDDLRTSSWPWPAWWGLLSPILLGPSISLLLAQSLPHARAFFQEQGKVDERAVFELLALSMGVGAAAPFVYSMLLWAAVDEHTEAFVNALLMGIARAALVSGALATSSDEQQQQGTRWLALFAPMLAIDVYAAIRALIAGSRRPGVATVFGLQTVPSLTGAATLSLAALLKLLGINHDWPFWLAWSLHTAGMVFGIGIPWAVALSNGGGWRSWFLRSDRRLPILSSVAGVGAVPPEPLARARTFDTSTLWADPAAASPDLADLAHPSGMRPLVRLWWEGTGTLEVRHDADTVVLRHPGGEVPVTVPAGTTATALAQRLRDALSGVRAEAVGENDLAVALPWPRSLADPGDDGPAADAVIARSRFVPVGDRRARALVLRHAPRADLATPAGLTPGGAEPFPVIPAASLGDLEGSGLGAAADLAALLATASAPTLGAVAVADGLPPLAGGAAIGEVVQVFRRWNLDERRLEEWRTLVTGGAAMEAPPAAGPDPLVRTPPAGYGGPQPVGAALLPAMGWLPLWRAWLRLASDPAADAGAPFAQPSTPLVRFPDGSVRRPTNAELTEGVRQLLDLGAT